MKPSLWSRLDRFNPLTPASPVVPVIRLTGVIGGQDLLRGRLTLAGQADALARAFRMPGAKAVALIINSPGGTPVQAYQLHKRIRALAKEHMVKVFAFCEDVAASGGYMLAVAADEIFAEESSVVGSIGVISAGFGFDKLIEKIGVERRVYTSGPEKGMLDPFRPERAEDVAHLKDLQRDVHEGFVGLVKERRGERLKGDDEMLFTGAFWSGKKALDLGLIDGIGDVRDIMRKRFGEEIDLRLVTTDRAWWMRSGGQGIGLRRPEGRTDDLAGRLAGNLIDALETRAFWSRFGL